MYVLSQLFMALGLAGLLISCAAGMFGIDGLIWSFGLLIVGVLMRLASRAPKPDPEAPNPKTPVRCPDCRELVRHDATKCKHCGTALIPGPPPNHGAPVVSAEVIATGAVLLVLVLLVLFR